MLSKLTSERLKSRGERVFGGYKTERLGLVQQLRQGPIPRSERNCTDLFFAIFYIFFAFTFLTIICFVVVKYRSISNSSEQQTNTSTSLEQLIPQTYNTICVASVAFTIRTAAGIIVAILILPYALIVYLYRNRLQRCHLIVRVASVFLVDHCNCIYQPLWVYLFYFLFVLAWAVCLQYTILNWRTNLINEAAAYTFITFLFIFFIWSSELFVCYTQIAASFYTANWYFSYQADNTKSPIEYPCLASFCTPLISHFGSVAFYALFCAPLSTVQLFINLANNFFIGNTNTILTSENSTIFSQLTQTVRMYNRQIFLMIALTGDSLCAAAKDSYHTVLRRFGRYELLEGASTLYQLTGAVGTAFVSALVGLDILTTNEAEDIWNGFYVALYFYIGYTVAHIFLTVVQVAGDSCLFYMVVDRQLHDGKLEHGPPQIKDLINFAKSHSLGVVREPTSKIEIELQEKISKQKSQDQAQAIETEHIIEQPLVGITQKQDSPQALLQDDSYDNLPKTSSPMRDQIKYQHDQSEQQTTQIMNNLAGYPIPNNKLDKIHNLQQKRFRRADVRAQNDIKEDF